MASQSQAISDTEASTPMATEESTSTVQPVGSLLAPERMVVEGIEGYDPKRALKVILEPFERGMGHTVGNALRRIILGFMPGAAVTEVKIDGVEQPYSNIEGVREDVIDILLNLKGVNVRLDGPQDTAVLRLNAKGAARKEVIVTAKDFQDNANITIANPDHPICTLGENGEIYLEATVTKGRGYVPASDFEEQNEDVATGYLKLDASYSPIERVMYQVDATRVEQRTDLDKLTLEVETNGTIEAQEIITLAASILRHQLNSFVDESLIPTAAGVITDQTTPEVPKAMFWRIEELRLSVRAQNALKTEGVESVGDLVVKTENSLLKTPHLGKKSVDEIKAALLAHGLELGTEVPGFSSAAD